MQGCVEAASHACCADASACVPSCGMSAHWHFGSHFPTDMHACAMRQAPMQGSTLLSSLFFCTVPTHVICVMGPQGLQPACTILQITETPKRGFQGTGLLCSRRTNIFFLGTKKKALAVLRSTKSPAPCMQARRQKSNEKRKATKI